MFAAENMSQQIIEYYGKHRALIRENLVLCLDPQDTEAVHNLRLSIKRLRVVARTCDVLSLQEFDATASLSDINRLFKKAGRLRDIQVLRFLARTLAEEHGSIYPGFDDELLRQEKKRREKFEAELSVFRQETLEETGTRIARFTGHIPQQKALAGAEELLAAYLRECRQLFHGKVDEERLHDIRARLKNINYLNNIFDDMLPVEDYLHINAERLRETGELAGAWHDHLILLQKMEKYGRKTGKRENQETAERTMAALQTKKDELCREYTCILTMEIGL